MDSDKAPLHCTNREITKKMKTRHKTKKGCVQWNRHKLGGFLFVFLFVLKIEHNAYLCIETIHQSLNKPEVKNINITKTHSDFQFFI